MLPKQTIHPEAHNHPGTKCDIHLRQHKDTPLLQASRSCDCLDTFSNNKPLVSQLQDNAS